MSRLEQALAAAVDALATSSFALVGGIAVSARTEPRFTRDLDLAVDMPDDAAAEDLVRTMTARGFRIAAVIEQEAAGRLATVRLTAPGEPDAGAHTAPTRRPGYGPTGVPTLPVPANDPRRVTPGAVHVRGGMRQPVICPPALCACSALMERRRVRRERSTHARVRCSQSAGPPVD